MVDRGGEMAERIRIFVWSKDVDAGRLVVTSSPHAGAISVFGKTRYTSAELSKSDRHTAALVSRVVNIAERIAGAKSSARMQCPECKGELARVVDLAEIFCPTRADYFKCGACRRWWMTQKGVDGPLSYAILGNPSVSALKNKAG